MAESFAEDLSHDRAFHRSLTEVTEVGAALLGGILPHEEIKNFLQDKRIREEYVPDNHNYDTSIPPGVVFGLMPTIQSWEESMNSAFDDPRAEHRYSIRLRTAKTEHWHTDTAREDDGLRHGLRAIFHLSGSPGTVEFLPVEGQPSHKITYFDGDALLMAESPHFPLYFISGGVKYVSPHPRHRGRADTDRLILIHDLASSKVLDLDRFK